MPPAKKPRKSNKAVARNQYTAELSSGQLVVGITILLIFGLACFLFGVLIGKFDPSLREQIATVTPLEELDLTERQTDTKIPTNETQKVTTSPPPPAIEQKKVFVPRKVPEKPIIESVTIPQSARPEAATPESTMPESIETPIAAKVDIPKDTPPRTIEIETIPKPVTPNLPEPTIPKPSVDKPVWSVQIAAYKTTQSAESERIRLSKKLPYTIHIHRPDGGNWTRVLVGHYSTRAEADTVRKDLVSKHSFHEPWLYELKK